MGREEIMRGDNDEEILKALLRTGNHLEKEELKRAKVLEKRLKMALKGRTL